MLLSPFIVVHARAPSLAAAPKPTAARQNTRRLLRENFFMGKLLAAVASTRATRFSQRQSLRKNVLRSDDERHHRLNDLLRGVRRLDGSRRKRASAGHANQAGVARFDAVNRGGETQHVAAFNRRRRAQISMNAGLFQNRRKVEKRDFGNERSPPETDTTASRRASRPFSASVR